MFEFDSKILDDYQGTLVANKLALDDFTEESLTQRFEFFAYGYVKMPMQYTVIVTAEKMTVLRYLYAQNIDFRELMVLKSTHNREMMYSPARHSFTV